MQNSIEETADKTENTFFKKAKGFGHLLIDTVNGFLEDNCMKLSASLAYYTVFSIGPLIIILIWALGFFYVNHLDGAGGARAQVFDELNELFGPDFLRTLDTTIQKLSLDDHSNIGRIIRISPLVSTSTAIFIDIQNSINLIYKVKAKPQTGWLKLITSRRISFSMISGSSVSLMASLIVTSIIGVFTKRI